MANDKRFVVKNGLRTQNIMFKDSAASSLAILLNFLDSDVLQFEGDAGTLLSLVDDLSGTIFSVNDVSGIPSIEVDADGTIRLAEFDGRILLGTDSDDAATLLQVQGAAQVANKLTARDSVAFPGIPALADDTVVSIDGGGVLGTRETAASAWTDATNASNISSGTLDSARIPVLQYSDIAGSPPGADSAINASFAIEASRLQTGRTISLTGDASGTSGSFDGTSNVSITVTVADNSHNHIASNITSGIFDSARIPTLDVDGDTTGQFPYSRISGTPTIGDGTLTLNVSGTGLSGSSSFTANQTGGSTFTVTSNATNANTGSTIVARDAFGNFSAGTITASLSGNASTATTATNSNNVNFSDTNAATTYPALALGATGNQSVGTDTTFNYDASSQTLNVQNLNVNGTTTTINTETLTIDDNIIVLNNNETGTPSQNAGIEIERGTSANKTLLWDEGADKWTVGSETFVAGTFEGNLDATNLTGTIDSARIPSLSTADITSGTFADARIAQSNVTQHEGAIDHDALTNFVANEHINHTSVSISAGNGMTGGGTIAASRTLTLGTPSTLTASTTNSVTASSHTHQIDETGFVLAASQTTSGIFDSARIPVLSTADIVTGTFADARIAQTNITQHEGAINHNALTNYDANEHIDHTAVSISAGNGMTGGGTIAASRTITMGTPSTLTSSTTNSVTASSHTHQIDESGFSLTASQTTSGIFDSARIPTLNYTNDLTGQPTIGNATITLTAGNGLITGGDFTTNQTGNETITFTMGTPSTLTSSTTNNVTASSHTHEIDESGFVLAASQTTSGIFDSARIPVLATGDIVTGTFADARIAQSNVTQHEGAIDHDALTNFVANEHINHTSVSISAGNGMTGGGTIAASRTITMGTPSTLTASTTNSVTASSHTHEIDESNFVLAASQITSGIFDSARIPVLATADIVTGRLDSARLPLGVSYVDGTVSSVAAGAGMDFTTITGTGSVILGTPSQISTTSTNTVSGTTHNHDVDLSTIVGYSTGGNTTQDRVKLRVWSDANYGVGIENGYSFGGLGGAGTDFAMTFQMNSDPDRGFWWGDAAHANAQGAMALTTEGKLTVANSLRLGYGEADTTTPGAVYDLDVSGEARVEGLVIGSPLSQASESTILVINANDSVGIREGAASAWTDTTNAANISSGILDSARLPPLPGGGGGTVTSVAAGAGMDFSTFSTSGDVILGTPSTLTASTTNATTTTSHTHQIDETGFVLAASQTTSGIFDSARIPSLSTADITSGTFADARISQSSVTQHEGAIDHDALTNFVANEHINHTSVSISAGNGMTGGGTIAANRTLTLGTPSTLTSSTTNSVTASSHTHQIDESGFTINTSQLSGVVDSANLPSLHVANDTNGNLPLGTRTSGNYVATGATGNGLTGSVSSEGGTFTVTMGTPSTLTASTSNATTASSHTHQIDESGFVLTASQTTTGIFDSARIPTLDIDTDTQGTIDVGRTTGDIALGTRTSGSYVQQGATGNGLTGSVNTEGGTFTVTMGTPSTLTASTSNATTASSHTHQIDESGFVLSASQTTSGVFDSARIPPLAAADITSGQLDSDRLPAGVNYGSGGGDALTRSEVYFMSMF